MGGTVSLLCTVLERSLDINVVFIPASGELWGRECKLAPSFVEAFLEQPRRPEANEFEPFPPETHFIDLALASGNLPKKNSQLYPSGFRRAAASSQTPQKQGRFGMRFSCGMRCGVGRAGRSGRCASGLGPGAVLSQAADTEPAGVH